MIMDSRLNEEGSEDMRGYAPFIWELLGQPNTSRVEELSLGGRKVEERSGEGFRESPESGWQ